MADPIRCKWGGCEQTATHMAVFTNPMEEVEYCSDCLASVRSQLDYQMITRL